MTKMTLEEAIGIVKCAIGEVEWNYPLDYAEAFEVAIEALEKQIPKKPYFGEALGYKGFNGYLCPICRNWLLYPDEIPNSRDSFCSFCGQKIDWSEVKNNA